MKCPRCNEDLMVTPDFPGGLGGALVRVDCPKSFCAAPLVARVSSGRSPDLELMAREEGITAAREKIAGGRGDSAPPFAAVAIVVAVTLVAIVLELPGGAIAAISIAAIMITLGGRLFLQRRAFERNTKLLLEALPHIPNALEAKARGYRDA
jgi:Flp pilus assembly protein TadB